MNQINAKYDRFKDAPWFVKDKIYCVVGGAGGISSWLSLFLARAGFMPWVYDFDLLETHNLGGQFFSHTQVGKPKVHALQQNIKMFANEHIEVFQQRYQMDSLPHNIVFSGFDNMKARKDMFALWKDYTQNIFSGDNTQSIFIDGRLLAEQMQIFCVVATNPTHIEEYEKNLFDDSEVSDGPCTFKQTSHAAAMIAAMMTGFFTNHITNWIEKNNARAVPLYTEYFIPLNLMS